MSQPDAGKLPSRWPTDPEIDAIRAELPQWALDHLAIVPMLSQAHRGRQATTPCEQANDSFREHFGPIGDHRDSVAWHAMGGPLKEIAHLVWPMMDKIAVADAKQEGREWVRAAILAIIGNAAQTATGGAREERSSLQRRPGPAEIDDRATLARMRMLIEAEKFRKPWGAAKSIVGDKKSTLDRLVGKYYRWEKAGFPALS